MANESIPFKRKLFFLAIEDTVGGGANAGAGFNATDSFLLRDGTFDIEEEKEVNEYDDGNERHDEDVIRRNWKMSGSCYLLFPETPGVPGDQSTFFRSCGFDEVADPTAKTITYTASTIDEIDTAHAGFQRKKKGTAALFYETLGARGTFGLKIKVNKRIDLTNVTYMGSYERPSETIAIEGSVAAQKARLVRSIKADDITTWSLDGQELCAQEMDIGNFRALELVKGSTRCDAEYEGSEITDTGSVTYKESDFANNNPYPEKGETKQPKGLLTFEINVPGKVKARIHYAEVEYGTPKEVELENKTLGIQRPIRFKSTPVLTFMEADA